MTRWVVRPLGYTTMKRGFQLASVLVAVACTAASCGPRHSAMSGPRCAFGDPEFTSSMGICNLVAEYHVAQRKWPLTKAQLVSAQAVTRKGESADVGRRGSGAFCIS